jgi:hypothetical protein
MAKVGSWQVAWECWLLVFGFLLLAILLSDGLDDSTGVGRLRRAGDGERHNGYDGLGAAGAALAGGVCFLSAYDATVTRRPVAALS